MPLGFRFDADTVCLTAIFIFLPLTVYCKEEILSESLQNEIQNEAYQDVFHLENIGRNMPRTQPFLKNISDRLIQPFVKLRHFHE